MEPLEQRQTALGTGSYLRSRGDAVNKIVAVLKSLSLQTALCVHLRGRWHLFDTGPFQNTVRSLEVEFLNERRSHRAGENGCLESS
jgi:hypothetical protein